LSSQTAQHNTRRPRRRRAGRPAGPRHGAARTQVAAPLPRPSIAREQAEYDPRPVPFETLGLESSLIEGIRIRGFSATTPIQSAVIPIVMDGTDLIACADTGTGKTAAFLLPILNRMLKARAAAPEERGFTRVLILAPTRELCVQIEDDVQGFTYHTELTSIAVYGGVPMDQQERALRSGVDIVVRRRAG
jgi:superfamily II DNA/RNA helicase